MAKAKLAREEILRKSTVKLFTVIKQPNYYQPWDLGYQESSGGSGCILEGHRILTNAHVVSDQVYVQVLRAGGIKKFSARVEHVDHTSEAAILRVEDPSFFDDSVPVTFGGLPVRQDHVAVYGFPMGGEELSITEGIVSRIEVVTYTHSQRNLLALQTDAAINPGNSGGPVFKDGKLVGIAFGSYSGQGLENTGFAVPIPVLEHFLEDVGNGVLEGVPELGVHWQKMESESLRAYYKLKPDQTGVLINTVMYGSCGYGVLEAGDVITDIGGAPVANDGSIQLRREDRLNFSYQITRRHLGEVLELGVFRRGKKIRRKVVLSTAQPLVPRPRYDVRPTYFLFAGFLFMPLTYNYMRMWDWKELSARYQHYYMHGLPSSRKKEVVIISQVLAHEINVGYHRLRDAVVERINGKPIREMRDVPRALARPIGKHHLFELDNAVVYAAPNQVDSIVGTRIVIESAGAAEASQEILARYGVPRDRSTDLDGLDSTPKRGRKPRARKRD